MKNIKDFNQYNQMINENTTGGAMSAQALLNNKSTEVNPALGLKKMPTYFQGKSAINANQIGVYEEEVDLVIDWLDFPMDKTDVNRLNQWLNGDGVTGPMGGNFKFEGPIEQRCVEIDGLWYPAVDQLRAYYNDDESFETLGSIMDNPELKDAKMHLLKAYNSWMGMVNKEKLEASGGRIYTMP